MAKTVGVLGTGAFGTAMAQMLALSEQNVLMWGRNKKVLNDINKNHMNAKVLPGFGLSERIATTPDLERIPQECDVIFIVVSAAANIEVAAAISTFLTEKHTIVLCSKGLRESDGSILSEVWAEVAPQVKNLAVLSGPSFAVEMMEQRPTSVVVAAREDKVCKQVANLFTVPFFRVYYSDDIIGAQVGGAVKNPLAIAAGIADGLGLGKNCRAAILSRGLAEMARYGTSIGAKPETFFGLAGVGDLMLSATSPLSRNYRLGVKIAQGGDALKVIKEETGTVEGARTANIMVAQAAGRGIDLGIIFAVDGIVSGDISAEKAVEYLLLRPRTTEYEKDMFKGLMG